MPALYVVLTLPGQIYILCLVVDRGTTCSVFWFFLTLDIDSRLSSKTGQNARRSRSRHKSRRICGQRKCAAG